MPGASGKAPAAIRVTPERLAGGPLARLRSGDAVLLDAGKGFLEARVGASVWQAREGEFADPSDFQHGMGPELFAALRAKAPGAEQRAVTIQAAERQGANPVPHAAPVHGHFVFAARW